MTDRDDHFAKNITSEKKYKNHLKKETRRKKLRSINKNFKRPQKSKRVRRKDWLPDSPEDWDVLDYEQHERIMPRNEGERRRRIEQDAAQAVNAKMDEVELAPAASESRPGLVMTVSKGLCQVDLGTQTLVCHIRGTLKAMDAADANPVAVGDKVLVSEDGAGAGVIEAVLPRRTVLARPDVFHNHRRQVIVANADRLLIVSAWREPVIWLELIDRYLIAAARNDLPVLICVNKVDLVEDEAECQAVLQPYRDLGYQILLTSALTGVGIEDLRAALKQQTTALSGLSGVGKSSLLRAVQPDLQLRTGEVNQSSGEGRHTTTQAALIRLDAQTAVIDTPGIREFGLSGLRQRDLAQFFPEMVAAASACRFANCTHLNEPDCAVQAAVEAGRIAASRYHSYKQIYETLPA